MQVRFSVCFRFQLALLHLDAFCPSFVKFLFLLLSRLLCARLYSLFHPSLVISCYPHIRPCPTNLICFLPRLLPSPLLCDLLTFLLLSLSDRVRKMWVSLLMLVFVRILSAHCRLLEMAVAAEHLEYIGSTRHRTGNHFTVVCLCFFCQCSSLTRLGQRTTD